MIRNLRAHRKDAQPLALTEIQRNVARLLAPSAEPKGESDLATAVRGFMSEEATESAFPLLTSGGGILPQYLSDEGHHAAILFSSTAGIARRWTLAVVGEAIREYYQRRNASLRQSILNRHSAGRVRGKVPSPEARQSLSLVLADGEQDATA